jgi:hypothetical protein
MIKFICFCSVTFESEEMKITPFSPMYESFFRPRPKLLHASEVLE